MMNVDDLVFDLQLATEPFAKDTGLVLVNVQMDVTPYDRGWVAGETACANGSFGWFAEIMLYPGNIQASLDYAGMGSKENFTRHLDDALRHELAHAAVYLAAAEEILHAQEKDNLRFDIACSQVLKGNWAEHGPIWRKIARRFGAKPRAAYAPRDL